MVKKTQNPILLVLESMIACCCCLKAMLDFNCSTRIELDSSVSENRVSIDNRFFLSFFSCDSTDVEAVRLAALLDVEAFLERGERVPD